MTTRQRKTKLTPLERLIKRNRTQLKNLTVKKNNMVEAHEAEIAVIDERLAEIKALLTQLTKK